MIITYGKREADWLKGIAIFMMLFHHFFGFDAYIRPEYYYIAKPFADSNLWQVIGTYCKLCVGLFSFTTGYAMFVQWEKYSRFTFRLKKAWEFLKHYWFVYALFLVVGLLKALPLPSPGRMLLQLFGLCTATGFSISIPLGGTVHPVFAWYVSFYLLFLLLAPVLIKLFSRFGFWVDNLLFLVLLNFAFCQWYAANIAPIPTDEVASDTVLVVFSLMRHFVLWGNVGIMGYLFAKYKALERFDGLLRKLLPRKVLGVVSAAALVYLVYLRETYGTHVPITSYIQMWSDWQNRATFGPRVPVESFRHAMSWDLLFVPATIYCLLCILTALNSRHLSNALSVLARHSTNIWFLHGMFFGPTRCFQWLIYWPRRPVLILAWTILLVLAMSHGTNYLYAAFVRLLRRIFPPKVTDASQ